MAAGRQHGDDDVAGLRQFGNGVGKRAAGVRVTLHGAGIQIDTDHIVTGPQKVAGHRSAHVSQSDESNSGHAPSPLPDCQIQQVQFTRKPVPSQSAEGLINHRPERPAAMRWTDSQVMEHA